jgi:hypothetical protein
MAKCKWCDKGGLFNKVSREGLCKTCQPTVLTAIEADANVIYEAMHVIERAQDKGERLGMCDKLLQAANTLLDYDAKGLETCSPPPRAVIEEYTGLREQWAAE